MKISPAIPRLCPVFLFAVLALVCAPVQHALAGERTVYRGTLEGAGKVVMELGKRSVDTYAGRYFYPRYGVDIPLRGTLDKLIEPTPWMELPSDYEFPENTADEESLFVFDKPSAIWKGSIHDDVFQGEWEDAKNGRKRAFRLERVAKYESACFDSEDQFDVARCITQNTSIDMKRTPYEYLKMAGHAIPVGKVTGNEDVAYQMWRDPWSKFRYPRLARHPNSEISEKINFLLEQRHLQMTLAALECQASMYDSSGGPSSDSLGSYEDEKVSVTFLSTTLMSITEEGSTYCGGAHPNDHWNPYTLDLLHGKYLDWNNLFRAFEKNENGFNKPSPELLKFIAYLDKSGRYYIDRGRPPESGDEPLEFNGFEEDEEGYITLYFAKPGRLAISLSGFGHCCTVMNGPYYSVPFSALKNLS
jgi:hypothetical protein